jgi:ribonuclease HI
MKTITLYSDGSSLGNPGPGGYGTVLEFNINDKIHIKKLSGGNPHTTNNQMELMGVIEGLKALKEPCKVNIYSDSKYVVQAINEWIKGWEKNGWKTASKKPVKNYELWQEYLKVSATHEVKANWVKGHNGHPQNEECDRLARDEAEKLRG